NEESQELDRKLGETSDSDVKRGEDDLNDNAEGSDFKYGGILSSFSLSDSENLLLSKEDVENEESQELDRKLGETSDSDISLMPEGIPYFITV
ncbi:hypothetical protein MCHI_000760, partial [Candidatus Magnetoovum chiemensis]